MIIFGKISEILNNFWSSLAMSLRGVLSWAFIRIYLIIGLILNLFTWLGAVYIYKNIAQDLTVLHYNIDFGIDLIGNRSLIFANPILGLFFLFINFILLLFFYRHKHLNFLAHLLLGIATLANLILIVAVITVYIINFS
jgi:hypothetical protein